MIELGQVGSLKTQYNRNKCDLVLEHVDDQVRFFISIDLRTGAGLGFLAAWTILYIPRQKNWRDLLGGWIVAEVFAAGEGEALEAPLVVLTYVFLVTVVITVVLCDI